MRSALNAADALITSREIPRGDVRGVATAIGGCAIIQIHSSDPLARSLLRRANCPWEGNMEVIIGPDGHSSGCKVSIRKGGLIVSVGTYLWPFEWPEEMG